MLLNDIKRFRFIRKIVLLPLLLLGLIGIILPVIPGLLFLYVFAALLNPDFADVIKEKSTDLFIKVFRL